MAKIIGPGSLNVDVTGYAPHLPVHGETPRAPPSASAPAARAITK